MEGVDGLVNSGPMFTVFVEHSDLVARVGGESGHIEVRSGFERSAVVSGTASDDAIDIGVVVHDDLCEAGGAALTVNLNMEGNIIDASVILKPEGWRRLDTRWGTANSKVVRTVSYNRYSGFRRLLPGSVLERASTSIGEWARVLPLFPSIEESGVFKRDDGGLGNDVGRSCWRAKADRAT
jgi:hypothetical protein